MGSIFDYLSGHQDRSDETKSFTLSVTNSYKQPLGPGRGLDQPVQVGYNSPYILQPPPLKAKHSAYCSTKSLESSSSNSDCYSSTTSLSTLPQSDTPLASMQDFELTGGSAQSNCKQADHGFSNSLFEKEMAKTLSSKTDTHARQDSETGLYCEDQNKDIDTDAVLNGTAHSTSLAVEPQTSHVAETRVLTETLTECNLTINPHHFDPL